MKMRAIILLALVFSLGGCWEKEPSKETKAYMSTLTKCKNDCKIDKPFLGGKD